MSQTWDLWFPGAGATGDGWPTRDDLGRLVLLPGGEAGVLTAWEHADDHS